MKSELCLHMLKSQSVLVW